jgi:hypothetical protein
VYCIVPGVIGGKKTIAFIVKLKYNCLCGGTAVTCIGYSGNALHSGVLLRKNACTTKKQWQKNKTFKGYHTGYFDLKVIPFIEEGKFCRGRCNIMYNRRAKYINPYPKKHSGFAQAAAHADYANVLFKKVVWIFVFSKHWHCWL